VEVGNLLIYIDVEKLWQATNQGVGRSNRSGRTIFKGFQQWKPFLLYYSNRVVLFNILISSHLSKAANSFGLLVIHVNRCIGHNDGHTRMSRSEIFMAFPQPQREAIFLRRPQRFLAEMLFPDGTVETVYCANPGSMTGFLTSDRNALLWDSDDPKRKRRYTWRAVEFEGLWIGTDTHLANRIVEEALQLKLVPGLEAYNTLAREQFVEEGFRVDFILSGAHGECFVEVKSSSVVENGVARYPDSVTPRGVNQLNALKRKAMVGMRSVLIFLVQRDDAHSFVVSNSHDPTYAEAFEDAVASGVEVIALAVSVSREGFGTPRLLPYAQKLMESMNTNQGVHL